MAAEQPTTANEYILHHLTFLSNKEPKGIVDFSVIHLDTVFFSAALALLFGGAFYFAARTAKAGVPGKFQSFVELLVETVDGQVKDTFHGTNKLLAPLALTIFAGFSCSTPWICCRSIFCPGRLTTPASNT
jgi:F-type H+-transporting ATPase subunit a